MFIELYKYFFVKNIQTADKPHGDVSGKFRSSLFKGLSRAARERAVAARTRRNFPQGGVVWNTATPQRKWRLLFAKLLSFLAETRTPCLQGAFAAKCHRLSLSSRRIFCAFAVKEKAGYQFSIRNIPLSIYFVINLNIFSLKKFACFKNVRSS